MVTLPIYRKMILNSEQGIQKKQEGWYSADFHVHSSCSHDVLPSPNYHPEEIYKAALAKGLHFITITDHDTMDAYDIIGWERERLVPGVEMTVFDPIRVGHTIHVNVFDLNAAQFGELLDITTKDCNLETFIEYVRDQRLPYVYNHPFWFAPQDKPNYKAVFDISELFPVLEYNFKRVRLRNLMTLWLAQHHKKGIIAATDTHIGEMGQIYTLSKGSTFRDYFTNITQRNGYIVPQDMTIHSLNREILTWIETIFKLNGHEPKNIRLTEVKMIDDLINFFANAKPSRYPYCYSMIRCFLERIVRTGWVSYFYLRAQTSRAQKIGKMLEIPKIIL